MLHISNFEISHERYKSVKIEFKPVRSGFDDQKTVAAHHSTLQSGETLWIKYVRDGLLESLFNKIQHTQQQQQDLFNGMFLSCKK
jgi:hypothetical protein